MSDKYLVAATTGVTAERALTALVQARSGEQGFTRVPAAAGTSMVPAVEPMAGLDGAGALLAFCHKRIRELARAAREQGYTWKEIGHALGLAEAARKAHTWTSIAAFELVTEKRHPDADYDPARPRPHLTYTCSCGAEINDYGPFGHWTLDEAGHREDCPRGLAARAAMAEAE